MKTWIRTTVATILLVASFSSMTIVKAEEQRTIADESIYDLLVDRFFNGDFTNDEQVNTSDPTQYAGGDFEGLISKKNFIAQMGFTIVSIGSVFDADQYTGKNIKSYKVLEEHFGTAEQLKQLIATYKTSNINIMVDFPIGEVAANHEWADNHDWIASNDGKTLQWDFSNEEVKQAIKQAVLDFVEQYEVGGLRFTNLQNANTQFLNELIADVKNSRKDLYILSNEESHANFDASYYEESNKIYRDIFKNVDLHTADLLKLTSEEKPTQIMIDDLSTNRFTYDSTSEKMFPPTRIKLALATTLLLPGVPVIQYGSEIVMNGQAGPEAHQLYNFKTDTEIIDYVKNIQQLRNESSTLRHGELTVLKNDHGFIALKRKSKDETWIIVINNTSKTQDIQIPINEIGVEKELRGMFDSEIVRENKNAEYAIILDRELIEIYQVIDQKGWNISYVITLALVFLLYILFIIAMMKRGKNRTKK